MNLRPPSHSTRLSGFTMIEIAIAIGIIGFALVAIIGILPRGMNVQKDNREDTIVSQDAPYFLNAIRNGEARVNGSTLTNYVESILVTNYNGATVTVNSYHTWIADPNSNNLPYDSNIIGILTTPLCDTRLGLQTNRISAIVRGMTGSAVQQAGANAATAFRYQMTVEVVPWTAIDPDSTNTAPYAVGSLDYNIRAARSNAVPFLTNNLREIRLKFAWPVIVDGNGNVLHIGEGRQTYRTLIAAHLTNSQADSSYWYFQPNYYTNGL